MFSGKNKHTLFLMWRSAPKETMYVWEDNKNSFVVTEVTDILRVKKLQSHQDWKIEMQSLLKRALCTQLRIQTALQTA